MLYRKEFQRQTHAWYGAVSPLLEERKRVLAQLDQARKWTGATNAPRSPKSQSPKTKAPGGSFADPVVSLKLRLNALQEKLRLLLPQRPSFSFTLRSVPRSVYRERVEGRR